MSGAQVILSILGMSGWFWVGFDVSRRRQTSRQLLCPSCEMDLIEAQRRHPSSQTKD